MLGVASGRDVGRDRRLVGVGTVQQSLRCGVVEQGGHAGDRGDPALAVHVDVRAVEAAGEQDRDEPPGALAQHLRIGTAVERVEIGDEDVHVPARVERAIRQRPDRADVVAEVHIPGRLDAGEGDGGEGHAGHLLGFAPVSADGAVRDHRGRAVAGPVGVGPELRPGLR